MCTVVVRVPASPHEPVRLLAVRDEDPHRPWNPLGAWWPDRPGVVGVQDRLAGGAWLAAKPGRLAVLLNRAGDPDLPADAIESRGGIVLDSVEGAAPTGRPRTLGFNLVEVDGTTVTATGWDGHDLRRVTLGPGTHMLAHDDVDDPTTARIRMWLGAFTEAPTDVPGDAWWEPWREVLAATARLSPSDDRAIVRDNRAHGYPTLSLLACVASVRPGEADVRYAELESPGHWNPLRFA
ncbi:NRDE family protein [Microbacterium album]|uniref:Transport and Golgi organization protein 2 n=1 Tax=Microbacterium album TaxID=2053191 RepID=A0A917MM09_9MICO|nr:NRDE family protein [Microbacterium album]GGH45421.1 hypothetical protein GCM10010921_20810 [Microbacterium album]